MKTKILISAFAITILTFSTMNAQEHDHSKMKKDTVKMEMEHAKMGIKTMYTCPMHSDVKSGKPGDCPKCGMELKEMKMKMDSTKMDMKHGSMKMDHSKMKKDTKKMEMKQSKMEMKPVYTCSMHPEVVSDKKGECPKCGMNLIKKKMEMKKDNNEKQHKH